MKLFSVILFLTFSCICISQTSENQTQKPTFKFSIGTESQLSPDYHGALNPVYISYRREKHQFGLGSLIGSSPECSITEYQSGLTYVQYGPISGVKLKGLQFVYRYWPNPPAKTFDLFFETTLADVFIKSELNDVLFKYAHALQNTYNMGLRIKLGNRFSINPLFGGGLNFTHFPEHENYTKYISHIIENQKVSFNMRLALHLELALF